ncbi:MAG TPA: c-type cytochrome [Usitatibacter sp.]|nr:c-type cytochrome [Usitatibacter sp.]
MSERSRGLVLLAALCLAAGTSMAQPARVKPAPGDDLRAVQATPQDVAEGKRVAQDACARCHGANGISGTAGIPHLAGQRAAYLHQQLRAYRQPGRPPSPMAGAVKFLSEDALVKVSAYYASLDPPPRTVAKAAAARADPVAAGKAAAASCGGCHGETGVTSMAGTPSLAGLDPRSFSNAMTAYKAGARKHDMMKSLVAGLGDAEISNLALFYALQKPARAQTKAAGDAAAGKAAAAVCAGCHGENGVSSSPGTPSLAGQDAEYIVDATRAYKDGSRSDEAMKAPASALDDRQLKDVAAYYASQAPQAPAVRKPLALAEWTERCDRCHGVNGNSIDPMVPALASQRPDWLEQVLLAYRSGARKSTAMSAMSSSLSEADVKDLAAHYARQAARPVTYVLVPAK